MTDKETNEFVTGLSTHPKQPTWIGGARSSWDRKQWIWSDGTPWSWTAWGPPQPDDHGGREACAWTYKTKWNDVPCSLKKNVVCQQSSNGNFQTISTFPHFLFL